MKKIMLFLLIATHIFYGMDSNDVKRFSGFSLITADFLGVGIGLYNGFCSCIATAMSPHVLGNKEDRKVIASHILKYTVVPLAIGVISIGAGIHLMEKKNNENTRF